MSPLKLLELTFLCDDISYLYAVHGNCHYVVRRVLQQIWVSTLKKEVDTELEETQYF